MTKLATCIVENYIDRRVPNDARRLLGVENGPTDVSSLRTMKPTKARDLMIDS